MGLFDSSVNATSPHPGSTISTGARSPTSSVSSSASTSESEQEPFRRQRLGRPKLSARIPSGSIIIPKGNEIQQRFVEYPPDDARAMSPRRNSADLERLGQEARMSLKIQAQTLQSSLQALAEKIDEVKSDHDKLESENRFLQDYIGGLTRTMSTSGIQSTSGFKGKK
ncbi:hypothetical protein GJ744_000830 [Endocarpon pusillum]|uniref:BZIP transcription factor n=1 Tax=Endocarpon pusillum TaxID=364733 RepID=A0A8H7AS65_9EURO|nr:hypothetical protein GJ744_000830 [Endocarpon pusillum]